MVCHGHGMRCALDCGGAGMSDYLDTARLLGTDISEIKDKTERTMAVIQSLAVISSMLEKDQGLAEELFKLGVLLYQKETS